MSDSDNLETRVVDHLDSLVEFIGKGTDFALDQAPEVFNEVVAFGIASHSIYAFLSMIMVTVLVYVYIMLWKFSEDSIEPGFDRGFWACVMAVPSTILILMFTDHLVNAVKAAVAPRLYVMEYIADMVN